MPIILGIIKSIIDTEDSPLRFEKFCIDLMSDIEGIEIVPTSRSWDLGRDGKTISTLIAKNRPYLCVTLEKDIDEKVKTDIERISRTTRVKSLIYCTSKSLSEQKVDEIESIIRKMNASIETIQIIGQIQLTTLSERHEAIFRKYYSAEINNIEKALYTTPSTVPDAKIIGLKLALLTHESNDSATLRKELTARLVLDTLSDDKPRSSTQLAADITGLLHLPRSISNNYIRGIISTLVTENLVTNKNDVVSITDSGKNVISIVPETANLKLLEGRVAIKEAIKNLSGHILTDSQFEKLWNNFQDGITELFHSHGLSIVKMIRSALAEETWKADKGSIEIPLEGFADHVVTVIEEPQQKSEIHQAIIDMFFEKDTPAFNWLTQICGIYVMMCSLGFETLSNEQIIDTLSCYCLVPDSDIVLSLLCIGESNHEDVDRILSGWKVLGGKLYMVKPILEEVAYHAWISEYDYNAFGEELSKLSDKEAQRLIENTFVRAFRKEAGETTNRKSWEQYIKQYKGYNNKDYGYIYEILKDDYGWGLITQDNEINDEFSKKVSGFLIKRLCVFNNCQPHELDEKNIFKARTDSKFITAVYYERQSAHTAGEARTYCIISSARLIKEVDNNFRKEFGNPEMVLSLSAIGFLLTLTPQVDMNFGTLRSILFDTYLATRLTPIQRLASRVIKTSGQWSMPWSRRVTLQRSLRHTVLKEAKLRGENADLVMEKVIKADDHVFSTRIIREALDTMAITPKSQEEIARLKKEKESLQKQLDEEKLKSSRVIKVTSSKLKRLHRKKRAKK